MTEDQGENDASARASLPRERRSSDRRDAAAPADLVGAIVRLMPDAAVVVDKEGRITGANALAEALFGYPTGALTDKLVEQLVPERFRAGHAGHRSTYTAHPTQRPMGAGLDLWAKRRDGSEFPVDISLAPLGVPERPLTLAAVRDLTERQSEWEALGRLAAIVSATDDAIVSADLNGLVTSWNPGAQRLLGYRAEEMVGRPIFRLVSPELRGEFEEHLARVRAGLRVPPRDTRRMRKGGDHIDVSESMSLIRQPSGDPIGFAWLMTDVTERKRAEEELRRLLTETQRRERWLEAISEIRLNILAGSGLDEGLDLIARRTCELVDSDACVLVLSGEDKGTVVTAASAGAGLPAPSARPVEVGDDGFGGVLYSGETWAGEEMSMGSGEPATPGPAVSAPLTTSRVTRGALVAARSKGRPFFERVEVRIVESLAQQAALAIEIASARKDVEQLALVADRERIARDLHDHVIQRLFAVGMALQAATHSISDSRALDRVTDSIEELDATIRDVRSTIFSLELRASERAETSPRSKVIDIATKAAAALGFQPRLQFDGPVDTRLPEEVVPDMLAVIRESLSNAARHARASVVEVQVNVHDELVVAVSDDGLGMQGVNRLSGLSNMRARAERRGGSMTISANGGRGTRIEWRVPLAR
jgi:PAS domain S-box-containing protein